MKVTVIGYKRSSFKTADGAEINGYQIFYSTPIDSSIGDGVSVDKAFVTFNKCVNAPDLGPAEIEYNRFGKVETFTSLGKSNRKEL